MLMIQTMYIVGIPAQRLPIGDINQIVLLLLIKLSAINLKTPLLQQILALTIYLSKLKERCIKELEGKKKDIEIEIAKEQIAKPRYTREQYKEFFEKSKVADLTDHNQRKALINYFVNAVVLYDDDAIFYLNYKENALKLSLSKIKKCSDSLLNSLPRENRHPHGCLFFSSIEEDKDSKNRLAEQAKPANAKVLRNTQNL